MWKILRRGGTGCDLKTHIKEHHKSVTKDNPALSKLTEHAHKYMLIGL
jgi:hypothetical protein